MVRPVITPSGVESPFGENEIIVSKTDLKGRITYVNDVFLRVSRYDFKEIVGAPHNIIRHPDMPGCVFKLMWDTIQNGGEMFAYVLNLASNGDHYWVFAHVTPSRDVDGRMIGFHSNRRKPMPEQVARIAPLYRMLREQEERWPNRKDGMAQAHATLMATLSERGLNYEQFAFSI